MSKMCVSNYTLCFIGKVFNVFAKLNNFFAEYNLLHLILIAIFEASLQI